MKKLILLFSVVLIASALFAKDDLTLTLYETYHEYLNKKGERLYEFIGYDWTMGTLHVYYRVKRRDEGRRKVTDFYGFSVGDQFYRIVNGRPYRVLMQGMVIYYENGIAHMNMVMGDDEGSEVELGGWSFISDNLTSEIIEFPSAKADKAFGEKPALQPLFECMKKLKKKRTEKIRPCVKENN